MVLPYFGWLHVYPLPSASIQSQHEVLPKAARYGDAAAWRLGNCFFAYDETQHWSAAVPGALTQLQLCKVNLLRQGWNSFLWRIDSVPRQNYVSTHCATHILIKTSTQRIQWQVHGRSGKHRQARFDAAEKRHGHIRHTHEIACVRLFWSHLQPLNNCDMQYSVRASPPKHPPNTNTLCLG
jgi:hypothetical protein